MDPLRYLAPPRPFKAISQASSKEIKERIAFADALVTHPHLNISEAAHEALVTYREACEILSEGDSSAEAKKSLQSTISGLEAKLLPQTRGDAVNLSFDLATKTKMGEEVDNLWNMWTFSRYQKYLPQQLFAGNEKAKEASLAAKDPWHCEFWKPFQGRLEAESEAFSRVLAGENAHNECPTYLLLALLTERHTLDWDETLALIKACASRASEDAKIEIPGSDIVELLRARDTTELAKRLDRDEASISLSAEYVMGVPAMVLAFFGTHLPEALFDTDDFDAEQWKPKKRLVELMEMKDGQEEAVKTLMNEMYDAMLDDESGDDFEDDEWADDDDEDDDLLDETAFSDDEEDY